MNKPATPRRLHRHRGVHLLVALLLAAATLLLTHVGIESAWAQTPPNANDITVSTTEDTAVTIDTGQARHQLYIVAQTNAGPNSPAHGTVSPGPNVGGNYTLNYTPGANQTTSVTFDYHFCTTTNPRSCGTAGTVTVNITAVNDAPTAANDDDSTDEDTPVTIDVLDNDNAGPADENQSLSIVNIDTTNSNGTAEVRNGKVRYTPEADFCGQDTFTYQAQDNGGANSNVATVTVDVDCVNDEPIANDDGFTVDEDSVDNQFNVIKQPAATPPAPGTDYAGPANEVQGVSVYTITTQPTHGTAELDPSPSAVSQILYTPDEDYCNYDNGAFTGPADSFIYELQDDDTIDGIVLKNTATVTVTVNCVYDKPRLAIENLSVVDDHMFTVDIVLNSPDVDVASLDFYLGYNCPLAPEVLAGTTPPAGQFFFDTQSDEANRLLHIITASKTNPASVLAGPNGNSTERTIGTVKFTLDNTCISNQNNGNANINLKLNPSPQGKPQFGDVNANPIPGGGNVTNLNTTVSGNTISTDIQLSGNAVPEGIAGAFVGFITTTDDDTGDTHTYQLADCPGPETNQDRFVIPNNADYLKLKGGERLNSGETAEVCIEATDNFGGSFKEKFTINVTNVNQPPQALNDNQNNNPPPTIDGPTEIDVMANDNDPDGFNTIAIHSVTQGTYGTVSHNGTTVTYTPTDPKRRGNDTFSYTIKDDGGLTDSANVRVKIEPAFEPADCNADGNINAADLTALGLELFDGDDNSQWHATGGGSFAGDPYGCNANQDSNIGASDLTCIGIIIFGGTCNNTLVAAGTTATATLAVGNELSALPGASIAIPVTLAAAGNSVAAAAFAVDFDSEVLAFDSTDSDGDTVPDAVRFNVPDSVEVSANYNAEAGRVEIILYSLPPFTILADGELATVTLTVREDASASASPITLTDSSLGDDQGQTVPLEVTNSAVEVGVEGTAEPVRLFLPSVQR